MTKVTTLRVPEDLAAELSAVSRADEEPVSEVVRAAIYRYIADRKSDPQFQTRLQKLLERDREVLERLAADLAA